MLNSAVGLLQGNPEREEQGYGWPDRGMRGNAFEWLEMEDAVCRRSENKDVAKRDGWIERKSRQPSCPKSGSEGVRSEGLMLIVILIMPGSLVVALQLTRKGYGSPGPGNSVMAKAGAEWPGNAAKRDPSALRGFKRVWPGDGRQGRVYGRQHEKSMFGSFNSQSKAAHSNDPFTRFHLPS